MQTMRLLAPTLGLLLLILNGCATRPVVPEPATRPWTTDLGAPVRGNVSRKQIALIFTGDEFGEGTTQVLDALSERRLRASFFVTGGYLRQSALKTSVRRMIGDGHYVGPHSNSHPLYCPWEDRSRSSVSPAFFVSDLRTNIRDLRRVGTLLDARAPVYFIPPYEWFNADQVAWARAEGVLLFNFTPGSGSNRDYAPEGHKSFVPSDRLVDDILAYERKDAHGLNGFLLLMHLGSQRTDKVPPHLGRLLDELTARGYQFVRVDELLK